MLCYCGIGVLRVYLNGSGTAQLALARRPLQARAAAMQIVEIVPQELPDVQINALHDGTRSCTRSKSKGSLSISIRQRS